ncbi:hypothetical protein E2C01_047313 [Portunus trituberculatus]|uniref:Uncharacterized protein n=1 Tax=Portunus trituberculatus TaxID=210409 RepID=A0A5B7G876_PORTR|nr:hypothetical protein [Portunus trituberculatus]
MKHQMSGAGMRSWCQAGVTLDVQDVRVPPLSATTNRYPVSDMEQIQFRSQIPKNEHIFLHRIITWSTYKIFDSCKVIAQDEPPCYLPPPHVTEIMGAQLNIYADEHIMFHNVRLHEQSYTHIRWQSDEERSQGSDDDC